MAHDVRVNDNQLCLVMGMRDMEQATDALRKLCATLNMPAPVKKLLHELCCTTERWGDPER